MSKIKLSLDDAHTQAVLILDALAPSCARLEIAGSIRRQRPYIGDVELVAIPHYDPLIDMFSEVYGHQSRLDLPSTNSLPLAASSPATNKARATKNS